MDRRWANRRCPRRGIDDLERGGYGLWRNLALGLTGAVIGGLLFRAFGIWPGLDKIAISLRDIVSAVVGSLLVLAALWVWRKFGTSQKNA